MSALFTSDALVALATLSALEIVLGVDIPLDGLLARHRAAQPASPQPPGPAPPRGVMRG
jgi:hypothetical protein